MSMSQDKLIRLGLIDKRTELMIMVDVWEKRALAIAISDEPVLVGKSTGLTACALELREFLKGWE